MDSSVEELVRHLSEVSDTSPLLLDFAKAYARRMSREYLNGSPVEALGSHVRHIFEFVRTRTNSDMRVRVFNPDEKTHGYQTPGAVVEVASPDMAFLVDSVANELAARGFVVERVVHPVIGTRRGSEGELLEVLKARAADVRESVQHIELDRRVTDEERIELEEGIRLVLADVRRTVDDFQPMRKSIARMIDLVRDGHARYEADEVEEGAAFLEWLLEDNFVFLGYREYTIEDSEDDGPVISIVPGSGLGILSDDTASRFATPTRIADLSPDLRHRYESGRLVVATKTNSISRVHRLAKMDYVGIRHIGRDGSVIGEARLLGLFTSKAYMTPADTIPILRRKLDLILEAEDTIVGSHHYKLVVQLFNGFLKDELFASPIEDLRSSIVGLVDLQEREQVKLFVRRDMLARNVSLLVVVPRDRFNAELRMRLQGLFRERFDGTSVDYRLSLGETGTARLHFTVWTGGRPLPDFSLESLEEEVVALSRTWEEELADRLVAAYGAERGTELADRWAAAFPEHYRTATALDVAVGDVACLDDLSAGDGAAVVGLLDGSRTGEALTRLSVYKGDGRLELSGIMPTLEDFGFRVIEEVPTRLTNGESDIVIHDFGVLDTEGNPLDLAAVGDRIAATVTAVLRDGLETDSLNRLIITAGLDHQQVAVLRAYRTYWQRVGSGFTDTYINDVFADHPKLAASLVKLFEARFDPTTDDWQTAAGLEEDIAAALDRVASLDEDRILRGFLRLIVATVRTNAFVPGRRCLSLKLDSASVPGMPAPAPYREIFVYAQDVEGIHLRGGRVARGGIRWSLRKEDYRTEILGLMKAQMTKNAIIVPTGSKGGFVLRRPSPDGPSVEDVRAAYVTFIEGLLDVTDNLVGNRAVHPDRVRVHDTDDPYLVVAADRGTAKLSDTANEVAAEYGYWLGDAFASGGSTGYDHKALGITARGAWESGTSHLRELGLDPATEAFTAVGIGDMSGDVFGNGMLAAFPIRLVAAFDHRHIFLDPDPDPATGRSERKRLFDLATSSWDDYDRDLLSAGGAIWPRSAKRIDLDPEAQRALGVDATRLTPNEVIQAILRAPVDLLFNGGIGTYVKASDESSADAGDRSNDAVRVDGSELRCRIVAEGGNLGFTQKGRIEFARGGGRIYTDFIDNSGGVNCSDREVNLKIFLGVAMERGVLGSDERDDVIRSVALDVVDQVLYDNFLQAQILSQEVSASPDRLEAYEDLMKVLESENLLDRELERLPATDEMNERGNSGVGLTGPELSVLLAYSKRSLRDWLVASDLTDSDEFEDELRDYFPAPITTRFGHLLDEHPLRRELVATLVANEVVNSEGITFVSRLMSETGSAPEEVVRAYHTARVVTGAEARWNRVEQLVGHIPPAVERELLGGIDSLVEAVTSWQLSHSGSSVLDEDAAADFARLSASIDDIGPAPWREVRQVAIASLTERGVPHDVAHEHAYLAGLVHAPDIIEVARLSERTVRDVACVFFLVGPAFEIDWLEAQVSRLPAESRWDRQAIQTVSEDLRLLRRQLAERVIAESGDRSPDAALDGYLVPRVAAVARLSRFTHTLAAGGVHDVASVIVAIKRIRSLVR